MWSDPCRWARHRLPLMAGDDLIGAERRRTERHLINCPACRHRFHEFREALGVLQTASAQAPTRPKPRSLWPDLARQIQESRHPVASSWGVSWSNVGFWSGVAMAAGLIVAVSLIHHPSSGRDPIVQAPPAPSIAPPVAVRPAVQPAAPKVAKVVPPRPVAPKVAPILAQATPRPATPVEAPPAPRPEAPPDRTPPPTPEPQPTH